MGAVHLRRLTTQEWADENPVLIQDQLALSTDTGDYKIGDGHTRWSKLPLYKRVVSGGTGGPSLPGVTDHTLQNVPYANSTYADEMDAFPTPSIFVAVEDSLVFVKMIDENSGYRNVPLVTADELQSIFEVIMTMVVPSGGITGQILAKSSDDSFALSWVTPAVGGADNAMVVAPHGDDADFPRPDALVVYWLGEIEPNNATDNDLWSGGNFDVIANQI